MLAHKKYLDISAFQNKYADGFQKGDWIVIQEKADGANASIQYNEDTDTLMSFSRRQTLTLENTLNGFKNRVDLMDKTGFKKYPNYRFFGENLSKHQIIYPQEAYNKFYLFDVYDTISKVWLPFNMVKSLATELELQLVPVFYEGEFISWEHIQQFIGRTDLGGEAGEGIVVKNMTRLNDPNNKLPFYAKFVTSDFREKKHREPKEPLDPTVIAQRTYERELAETIITKPRVRKKLYVLVEDNIIPEDWGIEDMNIIAKHLSRIVYHDCIKEEPEIVEKIGKEFGSLCGKLSMKLAKEIAFEVDMNNIIK